MNEDEALELVDGFSESGADEIRPHLPFAAHILARSLRSARETIKGQAEMIEQSDARNIENLVKLIKAESDLREARARLAKAEALAEAMESARLKLEDVPEGACLSTDEAVEIIDEALKAWRER